MYKKIKTIKQIYIEKSCLNLYTKSWKRQMTYLNMAFICAQS